MRRGIYTFDVKKITGMKFSSKYAGLQISNSIISYFAILVIIGIALFPLFWPLFWVLLYNYIGIILGLILSPIIKAVCILLAKKFLCGQSFIRFPKFEIKIYFN